MGMWFSSLLSYFGEKEARILVLGLDNAGKTTILCAPPRLPPLSQLPLGLPNTRPTPQHVANLPHKGGLTPRFPLSPVLVDRLQVGEVVSTIPSECPLPSPPSNPLSP